MITIGSILTPRLINLDLVAKTPEAATLEVAERLRGHEKVKNWNAFVSALKPGSTCITNESGYGICIPHARTNDVSGMVMAAGRSRAGIAVPTEEDPDARVHYLIVIGVPLALAADYLRIIGAIARTFRSPQSELALRSATTPERFIELLASNEMAI